MQKWEYLFVQCDLDRPRYVNGGELPNWKKIDLATWANQRGDEGWELVNDSWTVDGQFRHFLVFKRPKA